jgi:hypothetical protein
LKVALEAEAKHGEGLKIRHSSFGPAPTKGTSTIPEFTRRSNLISSINTKKNTKAPLSSTAQPLQSYHPNSHCPRRSRNYPKCHSTHPPIPLRSCDSMAEDGTSSAACTRKYQPKHPQTAAPISKWATRKSSARSLDLQSQRGQGHKGEEITIRRR